MPELNASLYMITAFGFQLILILHFSVRNSRIDLAMRYGWIVYALSIPACLVGMVLLVGGAAWSFWIGGFLYLLWAGFAYYIEYVRQIEWRNPPRRNIFLPYVLLYLATVMFYWWPLGRIRRELWFVGAALFIISTILNIRSHRATGS
jgi:hypothetical protein